MPDITTSKYVKTQLTYKGKNLLPRTSIDCVYDPATGEPVDLSKFVSTGGNAAKTYKINNIEADSNGNFTISAADVGAAAADHTHTLNELNAAAATHTHTLNELGAASSNHTHTLAELGAVSSGHKHEISDVNGLEARLLGLNTGGETVEGGFAMSPLNNNSYPEPSSWSNPYDDPYDN